MPAHRSASLGRVFASIGVVMLAAGCVGASDAVDVPTVSTPPSTVDLIGDTAPVNEPVTTTRPSVVSTTSAPTTVPPPITSPPRSTEPVPTTSSAPPPTRFLRIGDEGDDVAIMQSKLVVLQYLEPGYRNGVFDRATADAVIDFQAEYGLVVDGVFGPETDRSLSAAAASVAPGD